MLVLNIYIYIPRLCDILTNSARCISITRRQDKIMINFIFIVIIINTLTGWKAVNVKKTANSDWAECYFFLAKYVVHVCPQLPDKNLTFNCLFLLKATQYRFLS